MGPGLRSFPLKLTSTRLLALVFALAVSQAATAGEGDPDTQALTYAIREDFEPLLQTTERRLHFFHWGHETPLKIPYDKRIDPADSFGREVLSRGLARYWKNDGTRSYEQMGSGFYFSTDPAITQSYGMRGGNDAFLLDVDVPSGLRILDVRGRPSFSASTQALLGKLGCAFGKDISVFFLMVEDVRCRKSLLDASRELGIGGIQYDYESTASAFGIAGHSPGAFVLVDEQLSKTADVHYFQIRFNPPSSVMKDAQAIKSFISKASRKVRNFTIEEIWPGLAEQPDEAVLAWSKANLFGFDGRDSEMHPIDRCKKSLHR